MVAEHRLRAVRGRLPRRCDRRRWTLRIDGSGKKGTKQSYLRVAVSTDRPILERLARAFAVLGCADIAIRQFDGGVAAFDSVGLRAPMLKIENVPGMANLVAISNVCMVERDDPNWKAGFLAGFLDTDGSYSANNLRFHQTKDNGHLDATHRYIRDLGFSSQRVRISGAPLAEVSE